MFTLEFTSAQLIILDAALQNMPYGQVAALIADINRQIADKHALNDDQK